MVWAGSRLDIDLDWFRPVRSAERTGAGFSTLNGSVDSNSRNFFIPEFGYNQMTDEKLSLGVSVYGNGGMNSNYPEGGFNCGGGSANMLCGSGRPGVDLLQLVVAPTAKFDKYSGLFAGRLGVGHTFLNVATISSAVRVSPRHFSIQHR